MDKIRRTYWESEDFAVQYQMGPQKHRIYILDKLADLRVNTLLDVGCGTGFDNLRIPQTVRRGYAANRLAASPLPYNRKTHVSFLLQRVKSVRYSASFRFP